MKLVFALLLVTVATHANAQTPDSTAPKSTWANKLVWSLNLSEAAYTDWTAGGDNTLAYVGIMNGSNIDNPTNFTWDNSYKLMFGQARLGDHGLRKTDDEISLESILSLKLDSTMNPYASVSFKTQFAPGYTYTAGDSATRVSNFFDPAYFVESIGAIYQPNKIFKTRLGAGVREVLTTNFTRYSDNPETPQVEKTKIEGGFESVSELALPIDDALLLTSKLELFAPFHTLDKIIARSESGLTAKVNKFVTVNLNALFINDVTVTPRTQIKQSLSLGFIYSIL